MNIRDFKFDVMGFEHIHRHTDGSVLDGFATVNEYAEYSSSVNQKYLCITDHGMMSAVPDQIRESEKHNLTPLFGCELYVNQMQPTINNDEEYKKVVDGCNDKDKAILKKSCHLLAVAYNDIGYSNLVRLSTWSHAHGIGGHPRKPRVTHEQLMKHKEGILFTSCCYLSEIGYAFDRGGAELAEEMLCKYMAMFGSNYYLEIMLLDFKKQKPYDKFIVDMHAKYHVPLILTNDAHYTRKEDSKNQQYMLMTRNKNTLADIEKAMAQGDAEDKFFELQDKNLWMKSEDELNEKWFSDYREIVPYELFCDSKANTIKFCERAKNVKIDRSIKLPEIPDAEAKLWEALEKGMMWRGLRGKPEYEKRIKDEYDLLCRKRFCSYFLITKMFVDEARRICPKILGWGTGEEAINVGRGSAAGFLSCYLLGITDADPIYHKLIPERFLSDGRGGRQIKLRFKKEPLI